VGVTCGSQKIGREVTLGRKSNNAGRFFAKKEPALRDEARKLFFLFVDGMVPICIEEEEVGPGLPDGGNRPK
jgi:hypothetical protein